MSHQELFGEIYRRAKEIVRLTETAPVACSGHETQPAASNQNVGHGHVFQRPDGMKARCGGPEMCSQCAKDLTRKYASEVEASVPLSTYESAVKGRQDFRKAYVAARQLLKKFVDAWEGVPGHENMDRLCEMARNSPMQQDETTACSEPSTSDTQESAVKFIVGVAKDQRFSNEYLGNVVRSWLHVLEKSPVESRETSADVVRDAERTTSAPLMREIAKLDHIVNRASFAKNRADPSSWVLYLLSAGEISVGKALEWLHDYIHDGK